MVAILMLLPNLLGGIPTGHSSTLNMAWLEGFAEQLLDGELYPRWIAALNIGAGSPVFFFYAPVPFYLMALMSELTCADCPAIFRLAYGALPLLAFSGISFYFLAREYSKMPIALIGAIVYMLSPYHFEIDFWTRQAIAEFAAYSFIPLIFLFAKKIAETPQLNVWNDIGFAVAYAGLIMTHLPSTLIASLFLVAYFFLLLVTVNRTSMLARLLKITFALIAAYLLAAIYLVPALTTQNFISSQYWWSDHYVYSNWFMFAKATSSFLMERLLIIFLACTFITLLLLASTRKHERPEDRRHSNTLLFLLLLFWFFVTPLSKPAWEVFPILQKIQFPWRAGIILDLILALAVVHALEHLQGQRTRVFVLFICSSLFIYLLASGAWGVRYLYPPFKAEQHIESIVSRFEMGYDAPEYRPRWVNNGEKWSTFSAQLSRFPKVDYIPECGEVAIETWSAREIVLSTRLSCATVLKLRLFYYPTWHAQRVGANEPLYITPSSALGMIEIKVPSGQHKILLSQRRLVQEMFGLALSILGLVSLIVYAVYGYTNNRYTIKP